MSGIDERPGQVTEVEQREDTLRTAYEALSEKQLWYLWTMFTLSAGLVVGCAIGTFTGGLSAIPAVLLGVWIVAIIELYRMRGEE